MKPILNNIYIVAYHSPFQEALHCELTDLTQLLCSVIN